MTDDDEVNYPGHYTQHPSGVECIEITRHMGFNLGNVVKYVWRADLKWDALKDLKKARWYLNDEIAKREKVRTTLEAQAAGQLAAAQATDDSEGDRWNAGKDLPPEERVGQAIGAASGSFVGGVFRGKAKTKADRLEAEAAGEPAGGLRAVEAALAADKA